MVGYYAARINIIGKFINQLTTDGEKSLITNRIFKEILAFLPIGT